MARYLEVAAQANEHFLNVLGNLSPDISESDKEAVLESLVRIFNYGFRCNPRPASGTIRINAIKTATKNLPLRVSLVEQTSPRGMKYNALKVHFPTRESVLDAPEAP